MRSCFPFMRSAEGMLAGSAALVAEDGKANAGAGDEDRHERDVQPLDAVLERIDVGAQFLAFVLELHFHIALLRAEVGDLLLLLGREDEALSAAAFLRLCALQFAEL